MVDFEPYRNQLPSWFIESEHTDSPKFKTLAPDEILFNQGEQSESAYVVLAGGLAVLREELNGSTIEIDKLFSGDIVGEMGLVSGQPRTASIKAIVPTKLLEITADNYSALRQQNETIESQFLSWSAERWQRVQLASILANLFGELDAGTVHDLQNRLIWRHLASGDVLCRQNDEASSMYLIVSGRLRFEVVGKDGAQNHVGDAGPGETLGEFALITSSTRSATVLAIRESTIVEMTQTLFKELTQDYPELIPSITKIIVKRQQRAIGHLNTQTDSPNLALTLLPVDPAVDIIDFSEQLLNALSVYGQAKVIRPKDVDEALGRPGISEVNRNHPFNTSISQWLDEQEAKFDFLIYVPDDGWSTWTQRCVSQSDRILFVTQPELNISAEMGPIENQIQSLKLAPRQDLVLWHSADTEYPTGTLPWLKARPQLHHHYHIRNQDQKHFGRLARLILGKGIGVVFSGGGARGYVQMGVCQAMEELNIPIDYIGGSSFGSIMAGPPAQEKSVEWTKVRCDKFSNPKYTRDRTIPLVALNKSAGLVELTKDTFGDWQVEDLWIPYFATVTNLTTAASETIDRGPLWLACRKSISIPGVYSPVIEDGHVLVDGGVMNNFPIDILSERLESSRIIAVSVSPLEGKPRNYDLGHSISGWRLLLNRVNPFAKKMRVPSLAYSLLRTMEVNSLQLSRQNIKLTDVFMVISAKQYGFLDFSKYEEIIQIGYAESIDKLRQWKEQQNDLN